jgi:pimeloyl-ACP methyl ester carboxylesterase
MQRPMMNPMFLDGQLPPPVRKLSLTRRLWRALRWVVGLFFRDINPWSRRSLLNIEDSPLIVRFIRGLAYRLLLLPLLVLALAGTFVYLGTHPLRPRTNADPVTRGTYYDPVSFLAADGTRLDAWLVPLLDEKLVLQQREQFLGRRSPAVVLVHGTDGDRAELLPLAGPLHDAGFVVLVLALRSTHPGTGTTFGLREAEDVRAAVDMLRRRSNIDGDRIGVIGIGSGANAAALAAARDGNIRALVLDRPIRHFDEVLNSRLTPSQPWLQWIRPVCKFTFELAYRVDAEELEVTRLLEGGRISNVLVFDAQSTGGGVLLPRTRDFLREHLIAAPDTATANLP